MPNDGAYFSSLNSSYCSSNDEICRRCSDLWVSLFQARNEFSNVQYYSCTGRDGCICTAYCEVRESPMISLLDSYNTHREMTCLATVESKPGFGTIGSTSLGGFFHALVVGSAVISAVCVGSLVKLIRTSTFR